MGVLRALPELTRSKIVIFKNVQKTLVFQWFLKVFGFQNGPRKPPKRFKHGPEELRRLFGCRFGPKRGKNAAQKGPTRHRRPPKQTKRFKGLRPCSADPLYLVSVFQNGAGMVFVAMV